VGRLVLGMDAVGMRVGEGMGGHLAHHHAALAADVGGHADVAGEMLVAHAHTVACARPGRAGCVSG
jgi:hypothetical protein